MTAWRLYCWAFSVITLLSGLGRIAIAFKKPEAVSRMDILGGLFGVLLIPGLLGFAYQRPEGPHLFWIIAIPVQIAFSLCELFAPKMTEFRQKKGTLIYVLMLLFQVALGGPALYALVRYSYFSPQLGDSYSPNNSR